MNWIFENAELRGLREVSHRGECMRLICSFGAIVLSAIASGTAHSADISTNNDRLCAFRLEGEIVRGDYDRLNSLIARATLDELGERTGTLCLNSRGGSLSEGLKIAELIYTKGMSTLIADGSKCFSACAIIFMGGVLPEREIPYRKLSAGGVLGFHAPHLKTTEGKYSKEDVEEAAEGMRLGILGLLRLSSKRTQLSGNDFIKKSLLVELLERGPDDLFLVKTIGEAARWNIEIYDYADQFPTPNIVDAVKNLCYNFHYSNIDEPVPDHPELLSIKIDRYASKFEKNDVRLLLLNSRTNDVVCELYPRTFKATQDRVHYYACSYDYWTDKNFGDCREYKTAAAVRIGKPVPSFFTLAPDTLLKPFQNAFGSSLPNQMRSRAQ
jgi:hypothetical protein